MTCNAGYQGAPLDVTCRNTDGAYTSSLTCAVCGGTTVQSGTTVSIYCTGGDANTVALCGAGYWGNPTVTTKSSVTCSGT